MNGVRPREGFMRSRRGWKALLASAVTVVGLLAAAAPASAGPCYQVTVYDASGNPRYVTVCPYD
jgi:hypothetical protein